MIIATAGHVDHGKTALLEALTGVNADRLPEEKQRGMTIDLGYAYWPQPDGQVIGFIDVPGHEKFLANMLSGLGGIHHALLIIACDDGVMPQTREHLTLLLLAGQPTLTLVLTKADRVSAARIAEVTMQAQALVQQHGCNASALFITSSREQRGIDELRQHLCALPKPQPDYQRRFRLAVDRVFTLKGAGLVVTGTALSGQVQTGDRLWLTGANQPVRIRSLHANNQPADRACAGQRVALNIAGTVEKNQIHRGDWLLSAAMPAPAPRPVVALRLLHPVKQWQPVHIYHAASHITGRLSLLSEELAKLVPDAPLYLAENDRVILRDISAKQTLGAARVILLHGKARGRRQPDYLAWLQTLTTAADDMQALHLQLTQRPCSVANASWARQLTHDALTETLTALRPVRTADWLVSPAMATAWQTTLSEALTRFHQQHGDRPGIGRDHLRRVALPGVPPEIAWHLIDDLLHHKKLQQHHGWLHLPEFKPGFTTQEKALWQQIAPLFNGEALWVRDIARLAGDDEESVRQLLLLAARLGLVSAIVRDRYYPQRQIEQMAEFIRQHCAQQKSISAADFRNQLGVGRKLAIQILEFFDRSGFTRRCGDGHCLRDAGLFCCAQEVSLITER